MTSQPLPIASPSRLARAEAWAPRLRVLRTYQPAWLPRNLLAGLVLSALLAPQGMAYAERADLPPITGLYATVVCLLAYAVFGPSPRLVLGPDSSLGPITDLDSTAADMFKELDLELNARGIHLVFAELKDPVKDRFVRHGLLETIDARRFYPTLDAAVEAFHQEARA